jgi:hypothetical protein
MEIVIYRDLSQQYEIDLNDLYINDKKLPNLCRIKNLNESHSRFIIPYEKCSTNLKVMNLFYEIFFLISFVIIWICFCFTKESSLDRIYKNKLFGPINNIMNKNVNKNLIAEFECKKDNYIKYKSSTSLTSTPVLYVPNKNEQFDDSTLDDLSPSNANEKAVTKSAFTCLIDLLNLKLKMFRDSIYFNEIKQSDPENGITYFDYNESLYVQLSVYQSDKLNEFYEIKDKLKDFHLTIDRCWISQTQDENKHRLQSLIKNG